MFKTLRVICFLVIVTLISAQNVPNLNAYPKGKNTAVFLQGGHNQYGTDLSIAAQQRLWQSQNQKHEIHGGGSYNQHLGGPYGSSKPHFGGGVGYVYNFGRK